MTLIRILGCFLLMVSSFTLPAQDISYRKNTIYMEGKPYAYLHKEGSVWAKTFRFENLNNQELILIKPVTKNMGGGYDFVYYEVIFKGLDLKTEMQDDNDMARLLAYEFARFKVLQNDKLNREAVLKFIDKYPAKRFSSQNFIAR